MVKYLLSIGCPVDVKDNSDNYAVHYAAAYGWNDILRLLIEVGVSRNNSCYSCMLVLRGVTDIGTLRFTGRSVFEHPKYVEVDSFVHRYAQRPRQNIANTPRGRRYQYRCCRR